MAVVPASPAVIAAVVPAAVLPGVLRLAMVLPAACSAASVVAPFAAAVLVAAAILPVVPFSHFLPLLAGPSSRCRPPHRTRLVRRSCRSPRRCWTARRCCPPGCRWSYWGSMFASCSESCRIRCSPAYCWPSSPSGSGPLWRKYVCSDGPGRLPTRR
jgi:hypothetical protein